MEKKDYITGTDKLADAHHSLVQHLRLLQDTLKELLDVLDEGINSLKKIIF